MAWQIEFGKEAKRDLAGLDKSIQRKIFQYLNSRIATAVDARNFGKALKHSLSGLWCYRVGDYRIICELSDKVTVVTVLAVGHRSTIYD